jgi:hypothetical protein
MAQEKHQCDECERSFPSHLSLRIHQGLTHKTKLKKEKRGRGHRNQKEDVTLRHAIAALEVKRDAFTEVIHTLKEML